MRGVFRLAGRLRKVHRQRNRQVGQGGPVCRRKSRLSHRPYIKISREGIMDFRRRRFLQFAASAAVVPALPRPGRAENYPSRPIRLVLPFPPGGVFDIVGRPLAAKLQAVLGTVIVENQPGAGGSLAAAAVAHAPPDGYTIFLGSSSINLTEAILRDHPLLNPTKDLTPISMVAITGFAIAVNPSVPAKSLTELIAYIKENPGKLSYGSAGAGTMNHLSGELLKSLTGITDLPHVPYRGAGPAPRYGTCGRSVMPVSDLRSSPLRWFMVPAPAEPYDSLPGFSLMYAISSVSDFAGTEGFTAIAKPVIATIEIGVRSFVGLSRG